MTPTRLRLFAVTALLSVGGAVLADSGPDTTLQDIASYRQWTRVNENPVVVENRSAAD